MPDLPTVTARVLLVGDVPNAVADALEAVGHDVTAAPSLAAAPPAPVPAVVVTPTGGVDLTPVASGKPLREEWGRIPVVVLGEGQTIDEIVSALRSGVDGFVPAGAAPSAIVAEVRRARETHAIRRAIRSIEARAGATDDGPLGALIGDCPAIQRLRDELEQVAGSSATVLLCGETGTGKEVAARALHALGSRRDRPFVAINCAAIPGDLLESELFGHVRGAFTGARSDAPGLLRAGSGGTVLLDEVASMPPPLQAKLLRALQEGVVRPVGDVRERPFDARLVAATDRDLTVEVEARRFRQDLYYRLAVVEIRLPPLRERDTDVLLLAHHFVRRAAESLGKRVVGMTPAAARALLGHDWPGNVRELRNAVEIAVATTRFDRITDADLGDRVASGGAEDVEALSLEEVERSHIVSVLAAVDHNKSAAARILGITRKTLYQKIRSYGLRAGGDARPRHDSVPG